MGPRTAAALAVLALSVASCGSPDAQSADDDAGPATAGEPARVELDVFSGRPNPAWTLSADDDAALRGRLAALPAAPAAELHNDLGYRGLVVTLSEAGTPRVVRIQRGHVKADGAQPADRADEGRALERWVLETGKDDVEPSVYAIAVKDPDAPSS